MIFKNDDEFRYFKDGEDIKKLNDANLLQGFNRFIRFSKDGAYVFFDIRQRKKLKKSEMSVQLWRYNDVKLHSEEGEQTILASYNLAQKKTVLIGEGITNFPKSENAADTLVLVQNWKRLDEPWSIGNDVAAAFVSTKNGQRKELSFLNNNRNFSISPSGKFLVYFDNKQKNYFSYEISTETIRNLSEGLHVNWIDSRYSEDYGCLPRGIASWYKNDDAVLIYDQHDIWKFDLLSNQKPINLTSGYGKNNETIFNLALTEYVDNGLDKTQKIYLNAFNTETKDNGFFLIKLSENGVLKKLTMGPVYFNSTATSVPIGSDFSPLKAKNSEVYIVSKMSATQSPNYFSTVNFKDFTQLSDLKPEKDFNWYTTELHKWKSLDGRLLKGILYKPQNFDPNKKYPIVFHYYETKSDGLNIFLKPDPLCNGCNINIPTFVNHDYLVFTPDIYFKIGDPMQGTYDALVSAAEYVSKLPFVNKDKMGLQGCSFGGLQTNYLVTHTNLFSAACSASGIADLISAYGSLEGIEGGVQYGSKQFYFEGIGQQGRMGGTLWNKPANYIKNSPVFQIAKITTPILIMHGKKDGRCLYSNILEFFTGLRRLGKKSWMLVYPNAGHGLTEKEDVNDFSMRMMQFFDYYLKDKPAPVWMIDGISEDSKDIENGFSLETEGRLPGPDLLISKEREIVDSLSKQKFNPITIIEH
nr:prolyl oligopeptidase family serine peptidase [Pedobacter panaciterrae]